MERIAAAWWRRKTAVIEVEAQEGGSDGKSGDWGLGKLDMVSIYWYSLSGEGPPGKRGTGG